jgi:hypothetical protein
MTGRLRFKASELKRVVDHALKTDADLLLVHDQGVYLMSAGEPPDLLHSGKTARYVAYAATCHPTKDDGWWDNARDLVGGDDFAETVPWARQIAQEIERGAAVIVLGFGKRHLSLLPSRSKPS